MTAYDFSAELAALAEGQLIRRRRTVETPVGARTRVDGRDMLAFCSNDYLGLAGEPALAAALAEGAARWGAGAGASHLVSGHLGAHAVLEDKLAHFAGLPRALYFSTGYMANVGAICALAGRGDAVFSDALNHASLIDGARLSRAEVKVFAHRDTAALAAQLAASTARRKLVVTDSIFSMDGDIAPLPEMLALCEAHDALLLVDDAHGLGVLGAEGRGALAHFGLRSPHLVYVGTLGKAAGVSGAFVAGEEGVIEWLLQRARTYIFTTASPPAVAHAVAASLDLVIAANDRRARLAARVRQLREGLAPLSRWRLLESETPIQPLVIGGNEAALAAMRGLEARGIWVPAIRPPTVPAGSARLRITLSAAHTAEDVGRLVGALLEMEREG